MFCRNCGTQNPDGAQFCVNCGTPLEGSQNMNANMGVGMDMGVMRPAGPRQNNINMNSKSNRDRMVGMIAVAVMAVVILFAGVMIFSGRGYKTTVKKFINAAFKGDGKKVVKLMPKKVMKYELENSYYYGDMGDAIDDLSRELKAEVNSRKGLSGGKLKVSHKIINTRKLNDEELERVRNSYQKYNLKISAAKEVDVEVTTKIAGVKQSDTAYFTVIKVGRSWYMDVDCLNELF